MTSELLEFAAKHGPMSLTLDYSGSAWTATIDADERSASGRDRNVDRAVFQAMGEFPEAAS